MNEFNLTTRYNYDEFTQANVMPWMNFEASPPLGEPAPDFPLWTLDGEETALSEVWLNNTYSIVEFGSFS